MRGKHTLHVIAGIIATVMVVVTSGCGSGVEVEPTAEPVSLPPTRTPEPAATEAPSPTPPPPTATPSPPPPTEATSPTPAASHTPEPSPTPAESPTPTEEPVVLTPIGDLDGGMAGQEVTVEGRIVDVASFSHGFKFTLDDGSGQVVLLMWHNVYDDCWDAADLNLGAQVQATGEVGEYEGQLQIEPRWGGGVKALEPAAAGTEPRTIGSLSGADEGQRVTVEGTVVNTEGLSSAVKVTLDDGTGQIILFIWRNVLDRIPDNAGLGTEGCRVRATGTIDVYRGTLEVVPALPSEVTVLQMP